ncbi:hypothetical protein BDA96_02G367500 [Sorghum bicolor]|uniref:Uncharacterized protein n=1 Tax=Sorghum bicolor TaxID=4558 RepID=A0A921RTL9_SORBI|nr:hypothetical protein BDA96_02G367500 [Sorghum bicolor]
MRAKPKNKLKGQKDPNKMPYPPNTHFHFHDMIIGRPAFDQPLTVTPQVPLPSDWMDAFQVAICMP